MKNADKYSVGYYNPPETQYRWVKKDHIEEPPTWCSVDLRDGNQALIIPMSLEEKLSFFKLLVEIGFKEIEVGFPAASETEYTFLRTLIEENLIPDDVTIQVLTQAREHIIKKTFDSLAGVKKAIVHLYNSTSVAQREQVFKMSKEEIIKIATDGAKICRECAQAMPKESYIRFEYSPESFSGTEPEFALEVCNEVLKVWEPSETHPVIVNLPATVSMSMPHVYANQIEWMSDNLLYRENVIVSLHSHNDRGCAVAETELALLAGGQRVEGTLFGNGERTGNVDIITVAMNMYAHGVDPKLDFSDMSKIANLYEDVTRMQVNARAPYAGYLVFAAFSGSHQDAIAKGMKYREEKGLSRWSVPYLLIDPHDVGREYDADVIRVNSQSGKGGVSYILENKFGYELPEEMREEIGYFIKNLSDVGHKELSADEIKEAFCKEYVDFFDPVDVTEAHFKQMDGGSIKCTITVMSEDEKYVFTAYGNGRLDAISNALKFNLGLDYSIHKYTEHALTEGSDAKAISYVCIKDSTGKSVWGAGTHADIMASSVNAMVSAINRLSK